MLLQQRVKKYLDDIIDVAFKDEESSKRKRYKAYKLCFLTAEKTSFNGRYFPLDCKIEINNPSNGPKSLAATCLHELSHHIDHIKHGKSGHQKPFYEIYAQLIYASMDMGILDESDFTRQYSQDRSKVQAILKKYEPTPVEYVNTSKQIICVYNTFDIKDKLKDRNYKWNNIEQAWEKQPGSIKKATAWLQGIGVVEVDEDSPVPKTPYYIIKNSDIHIDAIIYIGAQGNTYEKKDLLKDRGFFFRKQDKMWLCKVKASELNEKLSELRNDAELTDCRFGIIKRK